MMNLEQLTYLVEVDKYKSITKAANNLFVSQSTISMSIAHLEKELNIIIFKRSKTGVTATANGKKIITYAQNILNELKNMNEYAINCSNNLASTIKITSAPTFCNSILIDIVTELLTTTPEIHIDLKENNNEHIIQNIYNGEIDIGIIGHLCDSKDRILNNLDKKSISYEEFYCGNVNLYLNKNHPLLYKNSITLQDLSNYPLVSHQYLLKHWTNPLQLKNLASEFYNYESIKIIIQNSNLIAIMPDIIEINDYSINAGLIVRLSEVELNTKVCYGCIRSLKNDILPAEKKIIDLLKSKCDQIYIP